jgi:hypothetical protein
MKEALENKGQVAAEALLQSCFRPASKGISGGGEAHTLSLRRECASTPTPRQSETNSIFDDTAGDNITSFERGTNAAYLAARITAGQLRITGHPPLIEIVATKILRDRLDKQASRARKKKGLAIYRLEAKVASLTAGLELAGYLRRDREHHSHATVEAALAKFLADKLSREI